MPCWTTLSRLPASSAINSAACSSSWRRRADRILSSSMSSIESAAKLLTKFSGFLISCAMPAVSWPSEASFSVWISRSCAALSSSSEFASSRVRASTSSNRRAFWIASTDCAAKVWRRSIVELRKRARLLAAHHKRADDAAWPQERNDQERAIACVQDEVTHRRGGSVCRSGTCTACAALGRARRCRIRRGRTLLLARSLRSSPRSCRRWRAGEISGAAC